MKPWQTVATASVPEGTLTLKQRGSEFMVLVNGHVLMGSRMHGSEEALARSGCERLGTASPRVLIGGLGFGYTLRAALDVLPSQAVVTIAELSPEIVEWNRGVLAPLAGRPLEDGRVRVEVGDVRALMEKSPGAFDVILLDVDNGPQALTQRGNASLYDAKGLAIAHRSLADQGTLSVWSASPDPRFERRLKDAGFSVQVRSVPATGRTGSRHVIFIGSKP